MTDLTMPSITFVVARSVPENIIGCDNKLPWRLRTDMNNFKAITTNHVVVMGRKTYDSIGHPLPNRINIVVSSRTASRDGNLHFVRGREEALYLADYFSIRDELGDIFVVGGGAIYLEFNMLFNKIVLTEVEAKNIKGDAFFKYRFDKRKWKVVEESHYPKSESDEYPFTIKTFVKRKPKKRARPLAEFMKADVGLSAWEQQQTTLLRDRQKRLRSK
jgi:dihydrofolate reductase